MNRFTFSAAAVALIAAILSVESSAHAYTFKTIYSFCAKANCVDGGAPFGPVTMDQSGNLYGMTFVGGKSNNGNNGTVYELVPNKNRSRWFHKVLHSFCSANKCSDGAVPYRAALVIDTSGNLYGTTLQGGLTKAGLTNHGVAFELMPSADRNKWKLKVLHAFCSEGGDACTDGSQPSAGLTYSGAASGLPYDGISPLYGTAANVAFKLTPGTGKKWIETVLYTFCSQGGEGCTDGNGPLGGLFVDAAGNLFGTTEHGGQNNSNGTVFELSPTGHGSKWAETVLYSFCTLSDCADGSTPTAGVVMDASGNLLGTTQDGGLQIGGGSTGGVVYAVAPNGAGSQETVLYDFCSLPACADGITPVAGVTIDASGSIFGTTAYTGHVNGNGGTVFELNGTAFQVLHSFCSDGGDNCTDGATPLAGLVMDSAGNLFGTTASGGANSNWGTIFELMP